MAIISLCSFETEAVIGSMGFCVCSNRDVNDKYKFGTVTAVICAEYCCYQRDFYYWYWDGLLDAYGYCSNFEGDYKSGSIRWI